MEIKKAKYFWMTSGRMITGWGRNQLELLDGAIDYFSIDRKVSFKIKCYVDNKSFPLYVKKYANRYGWKINISNKRAGRIIENYNDKIFHFEKIGDKKYILNIFENTENIQKILLNLSKNNFHKGKFNIYGWYDLDSTSIDLTGTYNPNIGNNTSLNKFSFPKGNKKPKKNFVNGKYVFETNKKVKEWVNNIANGICELCNKKAPFISLQKRPFLEFHHVIHLADGGSDTINNVVAICPNCHRSLHFSIDNEFRRQQLYKKIRRLKKLS